MGNGRRGLPGWLAAALAAAGALAATPAMAAPGLGSEVYAATVEPGEVEIEARYGVLAGGADAGEDNMQLEVGYGVNGHLRLGGFAEFEKEPGAARQAEALGFEAVQHVARLGGVDVAVYGEFELGLAGHDDAVEAKILLQRRTRKWDLRLNLIAEKPLVAGEPTEFGYATSADLAVANGVRLGATAYGELGTADRLLPYAEHFVGPVAKFRVPLAEHVLRIETGYLFAVGKAREDASGQFKLNLELEF